MFIWCLLVSLCGLLASGLFWLWLCLRCCFVGVLFWLDCWLVGLFMFHRSGFDELCFLVVLLYLVIALGSFVMFCSLNVFMVV